MRIYEVLFIAAPTVSKEDLDGYIDQLAKVVEGRNGKVLKIDRVGKRNLAYRIQKFKEGIYTILTIQGDGQIIGELERRFKVTDFVIRFLSIRIDEEMKRLEKFRARRQRRAAQSEAASAEPAQAQ